MKYYISDLHIGHLNCLKFDNRPFKTLQEENETIIYRWNNTVGKNDFVYILGDMFWDSSPETIKVAKALKGRKILLLGNHDHRWTNCIELYKTFETVYEGYHSFMENKKRIILSHYPILFFDKVHNGGGIHLYGHIHTNERECRLLEKFKIEYEKELNCPIKMINVGCMLPYMNYTPRTLEYLLNDGQRN